MEGKLAFQMNPLYVSTGAFTGRVNGRNPRLLLEASKSLRCDGFELMLFDDFYSSLPDILASYRGIPIPVVHSDKAIGDFLSADGDDMLREASRLTRENLAVCETVGAEKMVLHGWGRPDSDKCPERTVERILILWKEARNRGIDLLCENCVCVNGDPLSLFARLIAAEPRVHLIFDTRPAQFHAQLVESLKSEAFVDHAAHIHINDYAGGYKQWDRLYPIPQPGMGNIDWQAFFSGVRAAKYRGSLTLEAPSMLPEGLDALTFNRSLDFLRANL